MPTHTTTSLPAPAPFKPLRGVRILSLALNIPGPAALMRLKALGAHCSKVEPPSGDPLGLYQRGAYDTLHQGIQVSCADLRLDTGQKAVHRQLARADVLLTSFRPSALRKLGMDWATLRKAYPRLSQIDIVGSRGDRAEEPGHDLTYMAEHGLVGGLDLPPSLFADMGGSLMAVEAVLGALLRQRVTGKGSHAQVALGEAAAYLGLPRAWGLTAPAGAVGGAHAGYRVYACKDGRVAVAALEPHFATALCSAAGIETVDRNTMSAPATHEAIARFLAGQTRRKLEALAVKRDIPLFTLAG
ncbi:MAG: CoA transferase [Burkholderiaceae bacterium]|nr:CoA transferase [Rhodoferax sp.]